MNTHHVVTVRTSFGPRFAVYSGDTRVSPKLHATAADAAQWADYLNEVTR